MRIAIFGARSLALGVYRAIQKLYSEFEMAGFLVTNKSGNPDTLAGLPVYEIGDFQDQDICVLIATPEDTHAAIIKTLEEKGFHNYINIDSRKELDLMGRYYAMAGEFKPLWLVADGDSE